MVYRDEDVAALLASAEDDDASVEDRPEVRRRRLRRGAAVVHHSASCSLFSSFIPFSCSIRHLQNIPPVVLRRRQSSVGPQGDDGDWHDIDEEEDEDDEDDDENDDDESKKLAGLSVYRWSRIRASHLDFVYLQLARFYPTCLFLGTPLQSSQEKALLQPSMLLVRIWATAFCRSSCRSSIVS